MVINRGKRSQAPNDVNWKHKWQSSEFSKTSSVKKEIPPPHKLKNDTWLWESFHKVKDSHPKKLERRPRTFVQVSFRKLCGSKLTGLCTFDDVALWLSHEWCKNQKSRLSSWKTNPWSNFCDLHWKFYLS